MTRVPTISCVIPAYNAERYVERALESVLEQTLPPSEIIVVDDGSDDGTAEILAAFGDRIRIQRQKNMGPAAARNRGVELATGELIAFQDADDVWHREKLAKQVAWLAANPQTDACITHLRNIWVADLAAERDALAGHKSASDLPGYVFQTTLLRRSAFTKAGRLKETLRRAEDVEWFARARDRGVTIGIVPEVLVYRHLHGANLSNVSAAKTASEHYEDLLDIVAARLKRG